MKLRFEISNQYLKAVALAMPVSDIRYYLNGMLLEYGDNQYRLVCTDGHRLHLVESVKHTYAGDESGEFIVPNDMVQKAIKAKNIMKVKQPMTEFFYDTDTRQVSANFIDATSMQMLALEGKFPDYQRVIPKEITHESCALNWKYAVDAEQGLKEYLDLGKNEFAPKRLAMNGSSQAVVAFEGYIAVVMPMRADITKATDVFDVSKLGSKKGNK